MPIQVNPLEEDKDYSKTSLNNEEKKLITFLKKNSPKTEINNEIYRVQNLLNELYGLIEPVIQKNNIEFLYDIDESIPIEMVGDTLLLEQMLYHLLAFLLGNTQNSTLIMKLEKSTNHITYEIVSQHHNLSVQDDNNTACKLLIEKMQGHLSVTNNKQYTIHKITLPLLRHDLYQESYYQLPSHITQKKILLIEDDKETSAIISKIFTQFKLHITIENFDTLPSLQDFHTFDMLILDAKRITPVLMRHLQEVKDTFGLKIVSLENLFGWQRGRRHNPNALINKYLYKPLSRGMVSGLLYEMFVLRTDENIVINEDTVHKDLQRTGEIVFIEETPNIKRESFKDFGYKHILVVEDNIINQKIMQSILDKSHIRVTLANNGQEALDYINNDSSIDIVLMDINMPTMDGYQATKHIRKNESLHDLPIVIVSGLGFRNEIEEMYLVGADAHLTKPFKIGQLYTVFNLYLTKKASSTHTLPIYIEYHEQKDILDTQKGIAKMHNIVVHRDILREALVSLKHSHDIIKAHIIRKEYDELQEYCTDLLQDVRSIEAHNISKTLNEILILIKNHEEELLPPYITHYHDEWIKLKRNIELYLKSVSAY